MAFGGRRVGFPFAPLWRSVNLSASEFFSPIDQMFYFRGQGNLSNGLERVLRQQLEDEKRNINPILFR